MIGNGVTHPVSDNNYNSLYPFYHGRGIISSDTWARIQFCEGGANTQHPECVRGRNEVSDASRGLNRYQIFTPCDNTPPDDDVVWKLNWATESDLFFGEVPCIDSQQMNRLTNHILVLGVTLLCVWV